MKMKKWTFYPLVLWLSFLVNRIYFTHIIIKKRDASSLLSHLLRFIIINFIKNHFLGFAINPGKYWVLQTGRQYHLHVQLFDGDKNRILITDVSLHSASISRYITTNEQGCCWSQVTLWSRNCHQRLQVLEAEAGNVETLSRLMPNNDDNDFYFHFQTSKLAIDLLLCSNVQSNIFLPHSVPYLSNFIETSSEEKVFQYFTTTLF